MTAETLRTHGFKLIVAFACVYLFWGGTYLGIRFAVETMPPLLMAGVRFLIAGGAATQTVSHLQCTLELMEIEHRTIVVGEEESFPYADEVFAAMRQCAAGMIVVTPDDCHTDETSASALKQRMLHLINTSFVLYDRRVALLWDKRIAFPIQLSSLPNFSLEGDALTWAAGVKMMRVIKDFQRQALP